MLCEWSGVEWCWRLSPSFPPYHDASAYLPQLLFFHLHSFNSIFGLVPSFLQVVSRQDETPPARFSPRLQTPNKRNLITIVKQFTVIESAFVPFRLESKGLISKISIPCILPRSSNRSRPVACSRSVGTVPGSAPGGRRSSADWISAKARRNQYFVNLSMAVVAGVGCDSGRRE